MMPTNAPRLKQRLVQLILVAACALALAGCDKCMVPTWNPNRTAAPTSCHDDGSVK